MLEEQQSNINPDHVDSDKCTALHCAVIAGSLQTVELLCQVYSLINFIYIYLIIYKIIKINFLFFRINGT